MNLRLSPASPQDAENAERLASFNMQGYYRRYALQWSQPGFLQSWPTLESYLIVEADQSIGFLSLSRDGPHLYIRDIQLAAQSTGRGIGTWTLAQVLAIARARALCTVRLKVFMDNPARTLYERLGFTVVGSDGHLLKMERPLASPTP
ncbi:GNAT family N-acetyltransferase [Pseudomonas sp. LPB0260]|uniref:GNAT family N-acetyltransferase n=1 Tax=Pseudomonas sp. LPB0260 TaxID=2614442 RepID=UPI0015C2A2CD|nr:GNAT family N-acetyltransferase [Pseudomonas sp. LPB0260]QLC72202.1 GNAT family N-acetyltransferase [Pseudomonas sp. LPB0260]QLC74980.1 GNAT family N-acetyltransferase [Pseudomonas sp. LPB0260]